MIYLVAAPDLASLCPVCRKARTVQGRDCDTEIVGCPAALDIVVGHPGDDYAAAVEHLRASEQRRPVTLAAMAAPAKWLAPYVSGRPAWSYAPDPLRPLLWAALDERKAGSSGPARDAYRAAMDARWERCVDLGRLALGVWEWRDGSDVPGLVPDGARLTCTCKRGQECHLDWLAPHLVKAGHIVIGRDGSALP